MTEIQCLAVVNKYYPALQHVCVFQVIPITTKQKYGNEVSIHITWDTKDTCRPEIQKQVLSVNKKEKWKIKTPNLQTNFSLNFWDTALWKLGNCERLVPSHKLTNAESGKTNEVRFVNKQRGPLNTPYSPAAPKAKDPSSLLAALPASQFPPPSW